MNSYYWMNNVNGVEHGGPFNSIEEARADCIKTYERIEDIALDVLILRVIGRGTIVREKAKFDWQDQ